MQTAYEKIQELVKLGQLRLIGITAPARTGSTALEVAIASNKTVDGLVNQPFGLSYKLSSGLPPDALHPYVPPQDREEEAYRRILSRYEEIRKHGKPGGEVVLVIKEMTRNLGFEDTLERYQALLNKEILLIRNPLLSASSTIANLIMGLSPVREALHKMHIPDEELERLRVMAKKGNFRELQGELEKLGVNNGVKDALKNLGVAYDLNALIPKRLHRYLATLTDDVAWAVGADSLDDYAQNKKEGKKYESWEELKQEKLKDVNLSIDDEDVGPLLKHILQFSATGRYNLAIELDHIGGKPTDRQVVVDATLYRLNPREVFSELFAECGLADPNGGSIFSANALEKLKQDVVGDEDDERMYERVLRSNKIEPPEEQCPSINEFPPEWQNHIVRTAMPSYLELLKHSIGLPKDSCLEQTKVNDKTLGEIDPIFCKAVAAVNGAIFDGSAQSEKDTNQRYMFSIIEHLAAENNLRGLSKETYDEYVKAGAAPLIAF